MPPARCSNCGRFMNAIAGCRNPRCCTSDDVYYSSPPSRNTRKSSSTDNFELPKTTYKSDLLFSSSPSFSTNEVKEKSFGLFEAPLNVPSSAEILKSLVSEPLPLSSNSDIMAVLDEIKSLMSEQKTLNQHFTSKLTAVENLQDKVDNVASELNKISTINQNVRILESSSDEKYCQLSAECKDLRASVALVASDQEKLIAANETFVNEQVELRQQLKEVEDALNRQRSIISGLEESRDESSIVLLEASAKARNLELRFEEIIEERNQTGSEVLGTESSEVISDQLFKAADLDTCVENDRNISEISPRYNYCTIGGITFVINLLYVPMVAFIFHKVHNRI